MSYDQGYDDGYRAGMQKMREVGQARIDELEAKREWVGLTTEEFANISYEHQRYDESNEPWFDRGGFARAIEQILKEKNT